MKLEEPHPPKLAILQDGTEIRLVPLELTKGKPLYVSREGRAYSYVRGIFREIKPNKMCAKYRSRGDYFYFTHRGHVSLHKAVKTTWDCPCPPGYQCDHINGNRQDNRLENLEWVTREENVRRRWLMHAARGEGYSGKKLSEMSRKNRRKHNRYALKHGILVQLEIDFRE